MRVTGDQVIVPVIMSVLSAISAAAPQVIVGQGDDVFIVPPKAPHAKVGARLDFSSNPIPADFFGPGSDPFDGVIGFQGAPLETVPPDALPSANLIIRRYADTASLTLGTADTVLTRIVALHLESIQPVTISFNGGTSFGDYDVEAFLSRTVVQPGGSTLIYLEHQDGGRFEYDITGRLALDFTQGGVPVGTLDPWGPMSLTTRQTSWMLVGGPAGFTRGAVGVNPTASGIQVDGDGDGVPDYTTSGDSNFQSGFCLACTGGFEASPVPLVPATPEGSEVEPCPAGDADGDGHCDKQDNCPNIPNDQSDKDGDGTGDECDPTPEGEGDPLISEMYVAHNGPDDLEFMEIIGKPGSTLDGQMVLIVDGDVGEAGFLDKAIDLTGATIPPDGFFVIGDSAVPGVDLVLGAQDSFENGTQTVYLIHTSDTLAVSQLVGTDLDPDSDRRTPIPCLTDVIYDRVALWDGAHLDRTYDDAWKYLLGPHDHNLPPGIYRADGDPSNISLWCPDAFLDFDAAANADMPRTPGATNSSCPGISDPGTGYCFGDLGSGTPCPCSNDNDGSVPGSGCANGAFASGALLIGSGIASISNDTLVLSATGLDPNNSGLYFQANNNLSPGFIWGDGLQCAGGQLKRLGVRFADATGASDTSAWTTPISVWAGNVLAGDTKHYQLWYRDTSGGQPCGVGVNDFNSTNGLEIVWTP